MFVALRDLRFAKGRFALVGLVIGLVALMATLLSGLANGLVDDGISGLRRLPMTDLAFQKGSESTFSRSTLTPKALDRFKGVKGVEATPVGVSFVNARTSIGDTVDIALFGVTPDSFLAPEGEARDSLRGRPGVILSDKLASDGLKVGDELTIAGVDQKLPILGFTYSGTYGHVDIAFTTLDTWQNLYYGSSANGRFSAIALRNDGGADLGTAAGPDLNVVTKQQAYAGSPGYSGETQTMSLIRGFLLAISALIVGAFFTVWTVQRAGEIGILKALGASSAYVIRDAVGQMAVILVVSTVLGSALALGIGQFVGGDVPFRLSAGPILTSVGLLILLGLAGCLIAVRRITSVDPIVALRARN
jgi:putative ABC transport system permease protein